jgi:hypothetical protein
MMTSQSDNANKLDAIVRLVGSELSPLNYRRSKRRFNRLQPDGIVHVIEFQTGPNWSILRGKFTVEIGIFIPEVFNALYEKPMPKFIASHHCVERKRLGVLSKTGKDIWWNLADDEIEIGKEISSLLLAISEPYFMRFSSREKLLSQWEQERLQRELPERNVLIMAIILSYCDRKKQANELLNTEFGNQYKTAFLEYAKNIVTSLGLSFPTLK